jgi:nitrite transporter NirC
LKQTLLRSALSGVLIVVGCTANLASENRVVGAFLFTVALCSICNLRLTLYTGSVGYLRHGREIPNLLLCLLGNLAGCLGAGVAVRYGFPSVAAAAQRAMDGKLALAVHSTLIASVFCGILMFIAVETFKTQQNAGKYAGIFTCVPVFILCGFEHSVANLGYFALSGLPPSLTAVGFILLCVLGNGVGALLFSIPLREKQKPL